MKRMMAGLGGALILAGGMAHAQEGDALLEMSWDEIVETARGGEVNVFMWGGADNINAYVSDYIGACSKTSTTSRSTVCLSPTPPRR
ncbi:hypothetical protein [Limimaricola cinnabarinus]|uniref:Uncharacterized protein n=1 Tax=Limimaricola cinnabarinus LL-001 TaxID=1337093 RepID=U2Z302_9RHOB|nr:hypothetical protein [Limimaricola cinnabarinus]GAD55437.1 hypothetical protein MBELCI_1489 [Limimaricola cinnabarinus LL-001]